MAYIRKDKMVRDLRIVLAQKGYEVTQKAISDAYPGTDGSHKLWGVWQRRSIAPHWAANKLKEEGVIFTAEPKCEQAMLPLEDLESSQRVVDTTHRWARDLRLPPGDR